MEYYGRELQGKDDPFNSVTYNGSPPITVLDSDDADICFERETPEPEIVFILEGSAGISKEGLPMRDAGKGKMVFLPPGVHVSVRAGCGTLMVRMQVGPDSLSVLFSALCPPAVGVNHGAEEGHCRLDIEPRIMLYLDGMVPFLRGGNMPSGYFKAKVEEFVYIVRQCYESDKLACFFLPLLGRETIFRQSVLANIRGAGSVESLASLVNMSRSGFFHRFVRVFGESPAVYLKKYKTERILHDLQYSDISLQSLATLHGFNSYEVFSKFVKKTLGKPPRHIRKNARGKCAGKN